MFIFCGKPRAPRGVKIAAAAVLLALLLFYVLPKLVLALWFFAPEEQKIYDRNQYPAPMRVEMKIRRTDGPLAAGEHASASLVSPSLCSEPQESYEIEDFGDSRRSICIRRAASNPSSCQLVTGTKIHFC